MKLIKEVEIIEKKSKFIGYLYEIDNVSEAEDILKKLKEEHKKARHIPYAYVLQNTAKKSDDKEPNGSAGMPIFSILNYNKLNSNLIAIVRYFGGTKLGIGLLTRTYMNCAKKLIDD